MLMLINVVASTKNFWLLVQKVITGFDRILKDSDLILGLDLIKCYETPTILQMSLYFQQSQGFFKFPE